MYFNGQLVSTGSASNAATGYQGKFAIGDVLDSASRYSWDGRIYEVAGWTTALSANAIAALYSGKGTLQLENEQGDYSATDAASLFAWYYPGTADRAAKTLANSDFATSPSAALQGFAGTLQDSTSAGTPAQPLYQMVGTFADTYCSEYTLTIAYPKTDWADFTFSGCSKTTTPTRFFTRAEAEAECEMLCENTGTNFDASLQCEAQNLVTEGGCAPEHTGSVPECSAYTRASTRSPSSMTKETTCTGWYLGTNGGACCPSVHAHWSCVHCSGGPTVAQSGLSSDMALFQKSAR